MPRSHATDDFHAIRRRLAELRTERMGAPIVEPDSDQHPRGPRPYHASTGRKSNSHSRRHAIILIEAEKFPRLSPQ